MLERGERVRLLPSRVHSDEPHGDIGPEGKCARYGREHAGVAVPVEHAQPAGRTECLRTRWTACRPERILIVIGGVETSLREAQALYHRAKKHAQSCNTSDTAPRDSRLEFPEHIIEGLLVFAPLPRHLLEPLPFICEQLGFRPQPLEL